LLIFWQDPIFVFQSNYGFLFSIAILIAIEKSIFINQTLILFFQPDFDFLFSIKP